MIGQELVHSASIQIEREIERIQIEQADAACNKSTIDGVSMNARL